MPLAEDMNPVRHSIDVSKEERCQYLSMSNGMRNIVENIISSYETRIQSIGAIFDTTHQLLEGFQDSFLDTKQEREKINTELRENLAKNESLRKKDFDNMMQGILSTQNEREKEVKNLLKTYCNEQKETARSLRDNLAKLKDALAKGEVQRVRDFQQMIKEVLARQDERKVKVTSKLKEFQTEQKVLAERLKELLAKGTELRTKDLKSMFKEFKVQHKQRLARHQKRREEVRNMREEVCNMLGEFKKERVAAAKNWRVMQKKMAQRKTNSPEVINI